ncbi:MAG TPA: type IV pilus modification protein PilV [Burkholderiales bacterium]|nr:type IV pilus modification protein PilV [Burkholderiales bacterium]
MTSNIRFKNQRGVLLLEALIGILLFSIGVLAVVALQTAAIKAVTEAKFRSDASFLADQIIGQIWANRTNAATYVYPVGSPPAAVAAWVNEVQSGLPNAATYPPQVVVTPTAYAGPPAYTAYQVTVTLSWQLPDEFNAVPRPPAHTLTFSTSIPCC